MTQIKLENPTSIRYGYVARKGSAVCSSAARSNLSLSQQGSIRFYTHKPRKAQRTGISDERSGALWRNTFLASIVVVAAYKYAPEPTEDAYLTRWITLYGSPRTLWLELNAKHTAMEQANSEATILLTDAKKPKVHRYRYPQTFDQISPFLTPVGMDVDTSNFVVKGDRD
ncbi:hypothetical protein BDZ94DRAFT_1313276 [Collybia nuda]|uniref:Uncharacterized protein n=1 Tax=Collybia nuda TaxID=64659 RepID=A0A9P5XXC9_9AGAR|nr:hypothetical protein BDZ94DRAFT_1313276 [Collybia nuda]